MLPQERCSANAGSSLQVNIFVITLAYRSASMLRVNQLRAKKEKLKRWLKGWFSLSCLLGVQWAIGYVYVDGSNVFDYIFTAFNCSQVSGVAFNEEVLYIT